MELEMDSAQFHHHHHQEMSSQTLESMLVCNKAAQEKKPRPPDEAALKCPRCDSTNTKFCYYNNYSLTQPRYFCKSCRRYWTKGGTLRNVPVGGGCRKSNKRPSSSSSTSTSPTSSSCSKRTPISSQDFIHHQPFNSNHILTHLPSNYHHDSSTTTDLSLAFARLQSQTNLGFDHEHFLGGNSQNGPNGGGHDHFLGGGGGGGHHSFLDALRGGFLENGGNNNTNGLFHNLYSSYGDQSQMVGNVENGGILGSLSNVGTNDQDHHQLGMNQLYQHEDQIASSGAATTAVTVTTVKQESSCNNGREVVGGERSESSRVLWGFPWQIGGGGSDHQAAGQIGGNNNWNGFGSNWHGLLNSPLM